MSMPILISNRNMGAFGGGCRKSLITATGATFDVKHARPFQSASNRRFSYHEKRFSCSLWHAYCLAKAPRATCLFPPHYYDTQSFFPLPTNPLFTRLECELNKYINQLAKTKAHSRICTTSTFAEMFLSLHKNSLLKT